jgi:hypothetical protein
MEPKPDLKWIEELRRSKTPFMDFLKEEHAANYIGTDDDMPDHFDDWLGSLDGEDYIKLAEEMAALLNYKPDTRVPLDDYSAQFRPHTK